MFGFVPVDRLGFVNDNIYIQDTWPAVDHHIKSGTDVLQPYQFQNFNTQF